ncbi:lipopolysaccharide biosynthesis protein [uncultured Amnibacterium sp.]|uniref:lipopolysaccharide biosynthesis protein n=1 Tax=uncultured Amnibacterium sp. TaxID=1631851 RepID=UPI0035CB5BF3
MALTVALGSMSPTWYSIGLGRPGLIAKYEVFPRIVATAACIPTVVLTGKIYLYPIIVCAGSLLGIALYSVKVGNLASSRVPNMWAILKSIRQNGRDTLTVIIAGSYSISPVTIASVVVSTKSVALFSAADKIYRVSLFGVQAFGNAFQGWVAESNSLSKTRLLSWRMNSALLVHSVLGIVGGAVLAFGGPFFTELLFGPDLMAPSLTCIFYGVAFLAVSVNTSTGRHVLVPLGMTKSVFLSTIIGAAVGVVLMIVLGLSYGADGLSAGFAASEVAVTIAQVVALLLANTAYKRMRFLPV